MSLAKKVIDCTCIMVYTDNHRLGTVVPMTMTYTVKMDLMINTKILPLCNELLYCTKKPIYFRVL